MTFLGAPTIYYGDEVGMWGAAYPFNRMPMRWKDLQPYEYEPKEVNQEIFNYYQRLLAIRRNVPALSQGLWETVLVDDTNSIYVFRRYLPTGSVYVVLNRSDEKRSVSFDVNPHDANNDFIDLMDHNNVSVDLREMDKVDDRPSLKITARPSVIHAENRKLSLDVLPYGTLILGNFYKTPPN